MKHQFLASFFYLFCSCILHAQQQDSMLKAIQHHAELYFEINPFDDCSAVHVKNFPSADIDQLGLCQESEDSSVVYVDTYSWADHCDAELYSHLYDALQNKLNLSALASSYELNVVSSSDGQLTCISYPEVTIGSYKRRNTIMTFMHRDTSIIMAATPEDDLWDSDGYYEIIELQGNEHKHYLLIGSVKGCNTCYHSYVNLVHYEPDGFVQDYHAEIMCRDWNSGIEYDHKLRKLTFSYSTDDFNPDCEHNDKTLLNSDEEITWGIPCSFEMFYNGESFIHMD